MADFTGKTVIVTGAGTGMGAAAVIRFVRDGASVVLAGRRAEKLAVAAVGLPQERILLQPTDVSDEAACAALVAAAVERFGRLDVLVNNAGTALFGGFLDTSADAWRALMATSKASSTAPGPPCRICWQAAGTSSTSPLFPVSAAIGA